MKLIRRIITLVILVVILLMPISPPTTQAASLKLSPGWYSGKIDYSSYHTIRDRQETGDGYILIDSTVRIDLEGTLTFEVDKKGNIKPGAEINITGVPSNNAYQLVISDRNCNVISYISSESTGSAKTTNSGSSSGVIKGDINIGNASLVFFNVAGQTSDCQPLADQDFLLKGVNNVIEAHNKLKTIQFTIVRASKNSISGTINIPGVPHKENTPGGFILLHEKGFFLVQNVLSSLSDDPSGDTNAPRGEWRTK